MVLPLAVPHSKLFCESGGRPTMRNGAMIGLVLVLAACALTVSTNVEIFHDLPKDYVGQKIAIVAADPNKAGTIEFRTYAAKLGTRLANAGFQVVSADPDEPPDYVAALAYGVGAQQTGGAYTHGTITPNYVGGGWFSGVTTFTTKYPRALVVSIVEVPRREGQEPRQAYMMTAVSSGECRALSAVIDPILDAAFKDFPGESGRSRTVITPTTADLMC